MDNREAAVLNLFGKYDRWMSGAEIYKLLKGKLVTRTGRPIHRTQMYRILNRMTKKDYLQTKDEGKLKVYRPKKLLTVSFSVEGWFREFAQICRNRGELTEDDKYTASPFILTVYGLPRRENLDEKERLCFDEALRLFREGARLLEEVFNRRYAKKNKYLFDEELKIILDERDETFARIIDPYSSENAFAVLVGPSPSVLKEYDRNLENEVFLFNVYEKHLKGLPSISEDNKVERLASWLFERYFKYLDASAVRKELTSLRTLKVLGVGNHERHQLVQLLLQIRKEESMLKSCFDDDRYLIFRELIYKRLREQIFEVKSRDIIRELEAKCKTHKLKYPGPRKLGEYYRCTGFVKGRNILRTETGTVLHLDDEVKRHLVANLNAS